MAETVPARSEIAREHTWNAESVFQSPEAWKDAYDRMMETLPELEHFKGRLGDDAQTLVEWLAVSEAYLERVGHVFFYGIMSQSVDSSDSAAAAMATQANGLLSNLLAVTAFSNPEMLSIGRQTLSTWMDEEPRLQKYAHFFDDLFRTQAHVRSADVEEVLGLASDTLFSIDNTAEVLANADIQFAPAVGSGGESYEVTQGSLQRLYGSPDREVRRSAWESYSDGYLAFQNTFASNLTVSFKRDVFLARARRYPSTLEASLFQNNIPPEVFRNLIDTFRRNLPTWHRYWAIRRRALGVESLHPYDVWAPLTTTQIDAPYAQAVEWVCEGMQPLGEEYVAALRRGCLEERWVDVYPTKGKRQGAFSFGWRGTHPFIMMNYNDNLQSVSTLAHELGHSMHSYLTWRHQPMTYASVSLFVAEVASNFNQALVRGYLLRANDNPQFQIAVLEEALTNFHRYFFIMPSLARFELEMHERVERGEGVTAESMNALMADLLEEGYGGEVTGERDRIGITWAQFGHLYANYYVYQYATGIAAAHALAVPILAGEPGAAESYLRFLKAGGSLYPLDALALAGVDMTSPEPVEKAFATLARYVDRLEQLTNRERESAR